MAALAGSDSMAGMPWCPICRIHLVWDGSAWECLACRCRLVPLALLRRSGHAVLADTAWATAFSDRVEPGSACPTCRNAMGLVRIAGTTVEVCRPCRSLWGAARTFIPPPQPDAGDALGRALAQQHQKGEPVGDGPDDALKWGAGAIGLPVEVGAMAPVRTPWTTAILTVLLLTTGIAALTNPHVIGAWGFVPSQPWRYGGLTCITAFFIHAGWAHLLGNLWIFWLTGDNVEDRLGPLRFLLLLGVATSGGCFLHALFDPRGDLPCVGASGGISGLMAFYVCAFPRAQIGMAWYYGAVWLRLPAWSWFMLWIIAQLWLGLQQTAGLGHVSGLAHLGGAVVGLLAWWRWRSITPVAHDV